MATMFGLQGRCPNCGPNDDAAGEVLVVWLLETIERKILR